jgi:hypothetical protein
MAIKSLAQFAGVQLKFTDRQRAGDFNHATDLDCIIFDDSFPLT